MQPDIFHITLWNDAEHEETSEYSAVAKSAPMADFRYNSKRRHWRRTKLGL